MAGWREVHESVRDRVNLHQFLETRLLETKSRQQKLPSKLDRLITPKHKDN